MKSTNDLDVIASRAELARTAALRHESRKDQIAAYWITLKGPIPSLPRVGLTRDGDFDFIDSVAVVDQAIELILDGAPVSVFDWTKPPTPESLHYNVSARLRRESVKPSQRPRSRQDDRAAVLGATEYGLKALRDECEALAGTPEGSRNDQANRAAFNVGQLVGSGDLPESLAVEALWEAATSSGLPDGEVRATLRSGLESGKAKPRQR